MDKVFMHKEHREMWLWLADNPSKEKEDWPGLKTRYARNECFACEYSLVEHAGVEGYESFYYVDCDICPFVWPENDFGNCVCDDDGGLWCKWFHAKNNRQRKKLALQIANLPVKPGVITND